MTFDEYEIDLESVLGWAGCYAHHGTKEYSLYLKDEIFDLFRHYDYKTNIEFYKHNYDGLVKVNVYDQSEWNVLNHLQQSFLSHSNSNMVKFIFRVYHSNPELRSFIKLAWEHI